MGTSDGRGKKLPATPINNFPSFEYDGGLPDHPAMIEVFSLRRRNAEQRAKIESLNLQISRALETLQSIKRFFRLWILEGQGETYDQIQARMRSLVVTIDYLEDRIVGPDAPLEIPERWQKK